MVMDTLIAVPSEQPGGLDAQVGAHFGHCELYTLASIEGGKIKDVQTIPNIPHEQGGCMAPVNYLAQYGVKIMIAGGMGLRPLMGFNQVGIDVYHSGEAQSVKDAVSGVIAGSLPKFTQNKTCGGAGQHPQHPCGNHQH
jgi:predicted Fe-Mo cluster-binding NifX family protein